MPNRLKVGRVLINLRAEKPQRVEKPQKVVIQKQMPWLIKGLPNKLEHKIQIRHLS